MMGLVSFGSLGLALYVDYFLILDMRMSLAGNYPPMLLNHCLAEFIFGTIWFFSTLYCMAKVHPDLLNNAKDFYGGK